MPCRLCHCFASKQKLVCKDCSSNEIMKHYVYNIVSWQVHADQAGHPEKNYDKNTINYVIHTTVNSFSVNNVLLIDTI